MAAAQANPQAWLKGLGKQFTEIAKRAQEEAGSSGRVNIPEGDYTGILKKAELVPFNNGQSYRANFRLTVDDGGPSNGKSVTKSDGLDSEDGKYYFLVTLARLGIDVATLKAEQTPGVMDQLSKDNPRVAFSVVTNRNNPQFKNIYINGLVDGAAPATATTTDDEGEESGAPTTADETEEEPQAPAEPDQITLEVGMRINFTFKGEEHVGEVIEILEDEEKLRVKKDSDQKVAKIPYENLISLEDTEETTAATAADEDEEE